MNKAPKNKSLLKIIETHKEYRSAGEEGRELVVVGKENCLFCMGIKEDFSTKKITDLLTKHEIKVSYVDQGFRAECADMRKSTNPPPLTKVVLGGLPAYIAFENGEVVKKVEGRERDLPDKITEWYGLKSKFERELKKRFEYKVERKGKLYIAGGDKGFYADCEGIFVDLFIDKVDNIEKKLWKPSIRKPFNTKTEEREKRTRELYLSGMGMSYHSFEDFVESFNFNNKRHEKEPKYYKYINNFKNKTFTLEDVKTFFLKAYEHYNEIGKRL